MKRLPALLLPLLMAPAMARSGPYPAQTKAPMAEAPVAASPANSADAAGKAGEALAISILHRIGLVSQRENHFSETRQLHALKIPLHSAGTLRFIPPDHVEKLTLTPVQDSFIMEGGTVQLQHGQGPVRNIPLHMSPALEVMAATIRGPLQGDVALLQRYYTLSATGDLGQWRLTLTPRTKEASQSIRLVALEGRNNVLERTHLVQANNDVTDTVITPQ